MLVATLLRTEIDIPLINVEPSLMVPFFLE